MNKKNMLALICFLYSSISFGVDGFLCIGEFYFTDKATLRYYKYYLGQYVCEDLVDYWANHFRQKDPTFYSSRFFWWESEGTYRQKFYTLPTAPFPQHTD